MHRGTDEILQAVFSKQYVLQFDKSTLSGAVGGRAPKVIGSQFCKLSKDLSFQFVGSRAPCTLQAQTAGAVRDWYSRIAGGVPEWPWRGPESLSLIGCMEEKTIRSPRLNTEYMVWSRYKEAGNALSP